MWDYFSTNYGYEGRQAPVHSWARPYTLGAPPHNLHVERYHRYIKDDLKPNLPIIRFCVGLKDIDQKYTRKRLLVQDGIRNIGVSKLQSHFKACHPSSMLGYSVEINGPACVIKKHLGNGEISVYHLKRNRFPCNEARCLVRCPECPPFNFCSHQYTCECAQYAYR